MDHVERKRKIIVFQLDEEKYGLDIEFVKSIEKLSVITPVPKVNEVILGVMNLRGTTLSLIDLKKRLGHGRTELSDNTRVLIVNVGGAEVGLVVDQANDVLDLDEKMVESPLSGSGEEYIKGIARLDTLVVLLELGPVLDFEELIVLNHEQQGR